MNEFTTGQPLQGPVRVDTAKNRFLFRAGKIIQDQAPTRNLDSKSIASIRLLRIPILRFFGDFSTASVNRVVSIHGTSLLCSETGRSFRALLATRWATSGHAPFRQSRG